MGEFVGDGSETREEKVTDGEVSGGGGIEVGADLFGEMSISIIDDV